MPELSEKDEKRLERKIEAKVEKAVELKAGKEAERKFEKRIEEKVEKDLQKKIPSSQLSEQQRPEMPRSEVGILIRDYDFLFSDFDPRHLSQRAISDDFLREVRKFTFEEIPGTAELRFLIPEHERKADIEQLIKKRLREHFKKHALSLEAERKDTILKSAFLAGIGFTMMVGAAAIDFQFSESFPLKLLYVVLEPAGWFSVWYALDQIFYYSKEKKSELEFYQRMGNAEIVFDSY